MAGAPITVIASDTPAASVTRQRGSGVFFDYMGQGAWRSMTILVDVQAVVATETWTLTAHFEPMSTSRRVPIATLDITDADVGTIKAMVLSAPFTSANVAIPMLGAFGLSRTSGSGAMTYALYVIPGGA